MKPTTEEEIGAIPVQQYLTFMLGCEVYALDILSVKEIIEYNELTTVPMMPECIRGVINLRGAAVPVMDLGARFRRAVAPVTKRTCIIIVEMPHESAAHDAGIVVDAVNEVMDIAAVDIEPPPRFGAGTGAEFIRGMAKVGGRFVILLDASQLLAPGMDALQAVQSGVACETPIPIAA
jgi:purine-binding chemotaxis protein CheW